MPSVIQCHTDRPTPSPVVSGGRLSIHTCLDDQQVLARSLAPPGDTLHAPSLYLLYVAYTVRSPFTDDHTLAVSLVN